MARERNEKGQFVKGKIQDGAVPFSEGVAKEMQARSVASRLANKRGRELLLEMLSEKISGPAVMEAMRKAGYDPKEVTNELVLHARQIEKAQKTGDTKAYSAVMKAAGIDETTVNVEGPKLLVVSEKSIKAAEKWGK